MTDSTHSDDILAAVEIAERAASATMTTAVKLVELYAQAPILIASELAAACDHANAAAIAAARAAAAAVVRADLAKARKRSSASDKL